MGIMTELLIFANEKTPENPGFFSTPKGSRTPVRRLRTGCPGPLDDGGVGSCSHVQPRPLQY